MKKYGETVYATRGSDFPAQSWGTSTRKGDTLFVHILSPESSHIFVPTSADVKGAVEYGSGKKLRFSRETDGITIHLDSIPEDIDYIVRLEAPLK